MTGPAFDPHIATRTGRALGTNVVLCVTAPSTLDRAHAILRDELEAIDRTCSRFRPDSELHNLHTANSAPIPVSALLFEALVVAYDVARRTEGAVDPTVGATLEALGYDRDFAAITALDAETDLRPVPATGWWRIELDSARRTVRVPLGTCIDLGSSAKALGADRDARRIAAVTGSGVLVSLGGDIAVAGSPPDGGWAVGIAADSSADPDTAQQVVAIDAGGLATSSTAVRALSTGTAIVRHIVDPATGASVEPHWTQVSATGTSCVDANAVSTAAIVWGECALPRVRALGQPARLLRHDGSVATVNGWPPEEHRASPQTTTRSAA